MRSLPTVDATHISISSDRPWLNDIQSRVILCPFGISHTIVGERAPARRDATHHNGMALVLKPTNDLQGQLWVDDVVPVIKSKSPDTHYWLAIYTKIMVA